ncbi:hypothetical protein [Limosilactobacillus reuteri]|nr:hypothetical protein [Limosilactobacillus reuteri]
MVEMSEHMRKILNDVPTLKVLIFLNTFQKFQELLSLQLVPFSYLQILAY